MDLETAVAIADDTKNVSDYLPRIARAKNDDGSPHHWVEIEFNAYGFAELEALLQVARNHGVRFSIHARGEQVLGLFRASA